MPLSTIFQVYRGGKKVYLEEQASLSRFTIKKKLRKETRIGN